MKTCILNFHTMMIAVLYSHWISILCCFNYFEAVLLGTYRLGVVSPLDFFSIAHQPSSSWRQFWS